MNYLTPSLRELSRKFRRFRIRRQLQSERVKLAEAEGELGLLGWQQADFRGESQREVEKIKNCEREQSRLTNEGAEVGRSMRKFREEREVGKKAYEEQKQVLQAERQVLLEPVTRLEKEIEEHRREEPGYEKRIPDLDRELRDVQAQYSRLLAEKNQSPQDRAELIRLRERTVAIPNEKADLRTRHLRVASEIQMLESQLTARRKELDEATGKLRVLEQEFAEKDRVLATELKKLDKEKARIDAENDALELAKANPYQQLGRILADHRLPPVNQPHSLEKVLRYRESLELLEAELVTSKQESGAENLPVLRVSFVLLGTIVFLVFLVLGALMISG